MGECEWGGGAELVWMWVWGGSGRGEVCVWGAFDGTKNCAHFGVCPFSLLNQILGPSGRVPFRRPTISLSPGTRVLELEQKSARLPTDVKR